MMFRVASMLMLMGLAGSVMAKDSETPPLDLHKPVDQITAQMAAIHEDLSGGDTYSEISADQRSRVREALSRIQGKLDRAGTAGIPGQDQAEMFNDQEVVNTILTKAKEDSRLVCKRERATGSNMAITQCMTVAQRRAAREQGKKDLTEMRTTNNFVPGSGR